MKLHTLLVVAVASIVAGAVGVATAIAGGGNSGAAQACQNGGWQTLHRSDGSPFANQGDCISNAAQGGTLYSTVADVSMTLTIDPNGPFGGPVGFFYATNAGPDPVTIRTDVWIPGTFVGDVETLQPGETRFMGGLGVIPSAGCWPATPLCGQVTVANAADPDSTPGNYQNGFSGPAVEDDEVVGEISAGCLPSG
jgi:hypothetical protein